MPDSLTRRRFSKLASWCGVASLAGLYPWIRPRLAQRLALRDAPLPAKPPEALRLATWNLRNFPETGAQAHDLPRLRRRIAELAADALAVQEIRDPRALERELSTHTQSVFSEHGGRHTQRLGLVFDTRRLRLEHRGEDPDLSLDGLVRPALIVHLRDTEHDRPLVVIVVHLKAKRDGFELRRQQWRALSALVRRLPADAPLVVLGDFNVTGSASVSPSEELSALVDRLGEVGLSLVQTPLPCTAYWEGTVRDHRFIPSRLDLVWTRGFASPRGGLVGTHCHAARCRLIDSPPAYPDGDLMGISDHCPVVADLTWPQEHAVKR